MKDVILIKEVGRPAQAIGTLVEKAMEAARNGYVADGFPQLNLGMSYATCTLQLSKELSGEEASDKVIEEVPAMGASHEGIPPVAIDLSTAPIIRTDDPIVEHVSVEAIKGESVVAVSAEAIVGLKSLSKKKEMLQWLKANGVEIEAIPNTASALKKEILATVDPE